MGVGCVTAGDNILRGTECYATPAQDTGGPGRGNDNAFPAASVPVVDAATQGATTQEDEPEDSGSGSNADSEDDDRIDKLRGVVEDVVKQLASMKKKKKKKGKGLRKGEIEDERSNTVEPAQKLK